MNCLWMDWLVSGHRKATVAQTLRSRSAVSLNGQHHQPWAASGLVVFHINLTAHNGLEWTDEHDQLASLFCSSWNRYLTNNRKFYWPHIFNEGPLFIFFKPVDWIRCTVLNSCLYHPFIIASKLCTNLPLGHVPLRTLDHTYMLGYLHVRVASVSPAVESAARLICTLCGLMARLQRAVAGPSSEPPLHHVAASRFFSPSHTVKAQNAAPEHSDIQHSPHYISRIRDYAVFCMM